MYLIFFTNLIFNFILIITFGRYFGSNLLKFFGISFVGLSWFLSVLMLYEVGLNHFTCKLKLFEWINLGTLNLPIELFFDSLTVFMIFVVMTISFWVHFFSIEYMQFDPHFNRFFSYLTLFTIFMLILVTSSNFIQLFIGWEGVGLASYLLINFWFTRIEANRSALKAVILNRFGDFGLYVSLLLIFLIFKTFNFHTIFCLLTYFFINFSYFFILNFKFNIFSIIVLLLFLAAAGKSSQIGLHVWLPDAMEGPTPVSALIHAATMVTAGVFLLIRCSFILEFAQNILLIILLFGALTAFFSSTIGVVQNDIKKVIAYSTCSQLGYMIFACGCSNYLGSFFHLFNHAFFKALLFLGAGAIIHSLVDEQDLRKFGNLLNLLPFSYISMTIGSLALIGFPFLSGFYSKDYIIESSFIIYSFNHYFVYWLGSLSVFFTAFYSFRLLYLTFFSMTNFKKGVLKLIHESSIFISLTLISLTIFSIFFGFIFNDIFLGIGADIFSNSIYLNLIKNNLVAIEFLPLFVKFLPFFFTLTGLYIGIIFFKKRDYFTNWFFASGSFFTYNIYYFLSKKWYFDLIYFKFVIQKCLNIFYNIFYKIIDRGFFELMGPLGLIRVLNKLSTSITLWQLSLILIFLFNFWLYICILFYFIYNITIVIYIYIYFFILILNILLFKNNYAK